MSPNASICLVCSGPTNGIWHYGVECCRACASFFHRSMKDQRQYFCRSNNNCTIDNDDGLRNSCRACRLKKCHDVGMLIDEPRKKEKKGGSSPKNALLPSIQGSPDEALSSFTSPLSLSTNIPAARTSFEAKIPVTMEFEYSLRQFHHGIRALSIVEGISAELAGNDTQFKVLTYEEHRRQEKGTVLLVFAMIRDYFPAISELPEENKMKFLKYYAKQLTLMNRFEMTAKTFPHPDSPYAVMIPGGVIDQTQLNLMLETEIADPEKRQKFMKSFCDRHFEFGRNRYRPLNIAPLEFSALTALLFWNTVAYAATEFVPSEVYSTKREALYVELNTIIRQRQSQQFGDDDEEVVIRFGRLLDLLHQLAIFTWEVTEVAAMAKIFMDMPDFWDEITLPA